MFVSIVIYMNDGNIRYYLQEQLRDISKKIEALQHINKIVEQNIDDRIKQIANLKVHYTSLLNTALAYGMDQEEFESTL